MRAHYQAPVQDVTGALLPGTVVSVYLGGTMTLDTEPVYADGTSNTLLGNPFVTATGVIDFYLAAPVRVDLGVQPPGQAQVVMPDIDVNEAEASSITLTFPGAGTSSTQVGVSASAAGNNATALGVSATASGTSDTALGEASAASGGSSLAAGQGAVAAGFQSTAVGQGASTGGAATQAVAVGNGASASASGAVALGVGSAAAFVHSTAIGPGAVTTKVNQIVLGTAADTVVVPGKRLDAIDDISVRSPAYGAAGDGVTDDTLAFQNALAAAVPGQNVYVPAGNYLISAQLVIPVGVRLYGNLGYRIIPSASRLTCKSTFAGASLIAFAAGTPCGGISNLALDGTSLPAGSVDGIDCLGACKFGSITGMNIGHFTGHGINLTASGGNPDGWYMQAISSHDNGGDGIHWDYSVDGQLDVFHLDHNAGSGLALGTMNNCTISNGKCQQNTNFGYALTGGFVKSNSTFTGCMAENNLKDGWNFNTSGGGQGSIQLLGCSARDDGTSGASGSGYSGFSFQVARADILLIGCSNYVTASASGPDFGIKLTSCTGNVAIVGSSIGGAVLPYSDGGGNTSVSWDATTLWTGQSDSTRTTYGPVSSSPGPVFGMPKPSDFGAISATFDYAVLGNSTNAYVPNAAGANLYVAALPVPRIVTGSITVLWQTVGAGAAPVANQNLLGIYDSNGVLRGTTVIDSVVSGGAGAQSTTITLTGPLMPGLCRLAWVFNATTAPTILRQTTSSSSSMLSYGGSGATQRAGTYTVGQPYTTALPGTLTLASIAGTANLVIAIIR